ncbi:hypothetical protein [Kroppenstedtia eburnea]|uniref:Membrane domain of glycerophosphoryl diester phosphodiesterase n=1 Tax=Kroppenstedtia eburnea TaxID=714067 RepID=A0A1N7LZP2_9BACL|nr:hypothetical protein [Kroppenstedtia eburnea]QKI81741.1 hypothetical protein GXN75_06880 [Kroppenstedtia eburnea]SIS79283.1 hypothetical protein SAMN05421790_10599 [Kroppenstedtia eburnea]
MGTFFSLLRKHGLKMWGIHLLGFLIMMAALFVMEIIFYFVGLVAFLAMGIGVSVVSADNLDQAFTSATVGMILLVALFVIFIYLVSFLIQSFHTAGSIGLATEAVLDDSTSLNSYFRSATRYLWKMFLLSILAAVVSLPILIPWGVVDFGMAFASELDNTLLFFLCAALWLLLLVAMILFGSLLLYAPYIMIAENMGPWQSIRHSIRAARKSYGKAFVTLLLLIAAVTPFIIVYAVLAGVTFYPLFLDPDNVGVGTFLGLSLLILVFLLTFPLIQVIINLIISLRYKQHMRQWVVPEDPEPAPTDPHSQEIPDPDPYSYREPLSQPIHGPDPFLPPEENRQDLDHSRNSTDPEDPGDPYHR